MTVASLLMATFPAAAAPRFRRGLRSARRRSSPAVEHEVDLRAGPRERVVGADHDLAGAGFRDQVAHRLGREHDRVEIELAVLADMRSASSWAAGRPGRGRVGSPRPSGWRRTAGSRRHARRRSSGPGKRSSVPSKIRCDSAIVVSSGLPIVLVSRPLPASRPLGSSSRVPSGCMKTRTPSSSHLAQNGWNLGLASSSPATLPPTPTAAEAELS